MVKHLQSTVKINKRRQQSPSTLSSLRNDCVKHGYALTLTY